MKTIEKVGAKISLAMMSMGLMTLVTIVASLMSFSNVAKQIGIITDIKVPEIENATRLILSTAGLTERLTEITSADTIQELEALGASLDGQVKQTQNRIDMLGPDAKRELDPMLAKVGKSLRDLRDARETALLNTAQMAASIQNLDQILVDLGQKTARLADEAFDDLAAGSETAIRDIGASLSHLVEQDFQKLSLARQIRSEVNLLSGLTIAISNAGEHSNDSVLTDIAIASGFRLAGLVAGIQASGLEDTRLLPLINAAVYFSKTGRSRPATGVVIQAEVLAQRRDVDVALSDLIDTLLSDLATKVETANTTNEAAINGLMDDRVTRMLQLVNFNASLKRLIADVLSGAMSADEPALVIARQRINASLENMEINLPGNLEEFDHALREIQKTVDAETGIIQMRRDQIAGVTNAANIGEIAAAFTRDISNRAALTGKADLEAVTSVGNMLQDMLRQIWLLMVLISVVSVVLIVVAKLFVDRSVVQPLNELSDITENLSRGDMAPIDLKRSAGGELGRMASALAIFRENTLQMEELRARNKQQEAQAEDERQAMFSLLANELGSVVDGASRGDFSKRVEHEFEDAAIAGLANSLNALMDSTEAGLKEAVDMMSSLADGDLTRRMAGDYQGSFLQLKNDSNRMAETIGDIVGTIVIATGSVRRATDQINSGAIDLAIRAESQAASLEQTAAAMEQISATVKTNAENALSANALAVSTRGRAEKGREVVSKTVQAMSDIRESATEIGDIVATIEAIAFQTNLLALNAAVEAARAGDAGKGFAVVASEVRTLAQRSGDAAKTIKYLIGKSTELAAEGGRLVADTDKALSDILEDVRNVARKVEEISEASTEQTTGVEEVSVTVSQMDEITQQNATLADHSAAAARSLTEQSQKLVDLVGFFSIGNTIDGHVVNDAGQSRESPDHQVWTADAQADVLADALADEQEESLAEPQAGAGDKRSGERAAAQASPAPTPEPAKLAVNESWSEF